MTVIPAILLTIYVVVCFYCWYQRLLDVLHDREVYHEHGIGTRPRWYEYLFTPFPGLLWPAFFLIVLALELPRDQGRY